MTTTAAALRVAVIMPRNLSFTARAATAIDLCVRDLVVASRHRDTTCVVGEPVDSPFPGIDYLTFEAERPLAGMLAAIEAHRAEIVVVQQHRPTAASLAQKLGRLPVILHRHGPEKQRGVFSSWRIRRDYGRLDGVIAVSRSVAGSLRPVMPRPNFPLAIIHNGLDFGAWQPEPDRRREILFVGRLAPEKGALEAAEAVREILAAHPAWRARFIFGEAGRHPAYRAKVLESLAKRGDAVTIRLDVPHDEVKAAFERAAIALVPSLWTEPFGRTALEAFAGGAALITSGTGGLAEIIGDPLAATAITLPRVTPEAIGTAIASLIDDEAQRVALARRGRARGEEVFDLSVTARAFDAFLGAIAGRSPIMQEAS